MFLLIKILVEYDESNSIDDFINELKKAQLMFLSNEGVLSIMP